MSGARLLVGDVFDRMAELPDGSVDLVLTSPPFLALRSYLPADHPDKAKEIGSEPTPAAFLDTLLRLTAEWRRVLAPHGSICVELGDTYAGTNAHGPIDGSYSTDDGRVNTGRTQDASLLQAHRSTKGDGWPLNKSLCGIPHLYHLSLAYGRNLLTGAESPAGSWRVRNVVAWCRPNPPVGALGDKFRPGTSYMTVACVSDRRYFDLDAVREPPKIDRPPAIKSGNDKQARIGDARGSLPIMSSHPAGAPPLDWWEIPTHPYPGSHYATWPPALCERPIKAMCPQRVCTTCGKPSVRITSTEQQDTGRTTNGTKPRDRAESFAGTTYATRTVAEVTTLGWTDCGHDTWRTGLVLDPFAGSGTTLAVATGHGRDAIGIDLDGRNADLCAERVGMFLDTDYGTEPAA